MNILSSKEYWKKQGIYIIECLINHKKYIGGTVNLYSRIGNHKSHLSHNTHGNPALQTDWNSYGSENFVCYLLEITDNLSKSELLTKEIEWTLKFENRYNERLGNTPNERMKREHSYIMAGRIPSDETRKSMSLTHSGHLVSDNTRKKMSLACLGKKHPHIGHKHSDETRKKISLTLRERKREIINHQPIKNQDEIQNENN